MIIDNVNVYGLAESIVASGLPMKCDYSKEQFSTDVNDVIISLMNDDDTTMNAERHITRAVDRLSRFESGEGHHCFLCGVNVQFNVTAPRYWFPEMQRYHFADIVSSTSTMHMLKSFVRKCGEIEDTDELEKFIMSRFSKNTCYCTALGFVMYSRTVLDDEDGIEKIKANLPDGYLQTARFTTNYRQLKTIYHQRKNHRLAEWKEFCKWIDTLPLSQMITGGYEKCII